MFFLLTLSLMLIAQCSISINCIFLIFLNLNTAALPAQILYLPLPRCWSAPTLPPPLTSSPWAWSSSCCWPAATNRSGRRTTSPRYRGHSSNLQTSDRYWGSSKNNFVIKGAHKQPKRPFQQSCFPGQNYSPAKNSPAKIILPPILFYRQNYSSAWI